MFAVQLFVGPLVCVQGTDRSLVWEPCLVAVVAVADMRQGLANTGFVQRHEQWCTWGPYKTDSQTDCCELKRNNGNMS